MRGPYCIENECMSSYRCEKSILDHRLDREGVYLSLGRSPHLSIPFYFYLAWFLSTVVCGVVGALIWLRSLIKHLFVDDTGAHRVHEHDLIIKKNLLNTFGTIPPWGTKISSLHACDTDFLVAGLMFARTWSCAIPTMSFVIPECICVRKMRRNCSCIQLDPILSRHSAHNTYYY